MLFDISDGDDSCLGGNSSRRSGRNRNSRREGKEKE